MVKEAAVPSTQTAGGHSAASRLYRQWERSRSSVQNAKRCSWAATGKKI